MTAGLNVHGPLSLYGTLVFAIPVQDFPADPALGTLVLKDHVLHAYLKIGDLETWYPFSSKTESYVHNQALPTLTWTVNHMLGTPDVWYQIKDASGQIVSVGKTDLNENSFQLHFTTAITGTCVVVAPTTIDVPQVKATRILVGGNGEVEINSAGVYVNGESVLTNAVIADDIAAAVAPKADQSYVDAQIALKADQVHTHAQYLPSAQYTAEDVLAKVTAVDGSGSGLDADLLDGRQAGDFATKVTLQGDVTGTATATGSEIVLTAAVVDGSHGHSIANVSGLQDALDAKEIAANRNAPNGYAGLDASGKVASDQLPSYVDDVLEYASAASFPGVGEDGKIYLALDTSKAYRWSGTLYVEISAPAQSATTMEMQAGTVTDRRSMSPKDIHDAVKALMANMTWAGLP